MTLPAPSAPIHEALAALALTEAERAACVALTGVRTLGDLAVVLERGEVESVLAKKLKKLLT